MGGGSGGPRPRERDPQSRLVAALAVALACFALWRVRQGVDHGDGAHVVAQAVRMARGATPFVDEMNAQALGALLAVPFTWVWLQVVGLEGIVLASRVWYLALAFSAGALCYRALRTGLRPLPALAGAVLACTPTAYNLLVTSYNTVPGLALAVATFAGWAALTRPSGRWAAVGGLALALAVLSHPASLPAAAVLGLVLLVLARHRAGVVRGLLLGGGGLSLLVLVWVVAGPGLGALLETLSYTADYQAGRPHPLDRVQDTTGRLVRALVAPATWPAICLAALAALTPLPDRARGAALALVPVAMALPALLSLPTEGQPVVGATSGTYAILLCALLLLPVALSARQEPVLRLLLLVAGPTAVVGLLTYAATTSSSARWGAVVPPVVPLLGVLGVGVVLLCARRGVAAGIAVACLLLPLLGVQSLHAFRDPAPWVAHVRIPEGPNAGLRTTPERAADDCGFRVAAASWIAPGESVLAYAGPAVYLYTDGPAATNIVWLAGFGKANRTTVERLDEQGAWPDVVTVLASVARAWDEHATDDPLLQRLERDYGEPVPAGPFWVLRRDGTTTPPGGEPDLAACGLS